MIVVFTYLYLHVNSVILLLEKLLISYSKINATSLEVNNKKYIFKDEGLAWMIVCLQLYLNTSK